MKKCSRCKENKPLIEFNQCGKGRTRGECKLCRSYGRINKEAKKREAERQKLLDSRMKICPLCGKIKPFSSFHKNIARKTDGRQSYCTECYSKKTYHNSKRAENNTLYKKGLKRCTICLDVLKLSDFYSVNGIVKQPCKKCWVVKEKTYRDSETYKENKKNRIKTQERKRNSLVPITSTMIKNVPHIDKPMIEKGYLSVECKKCKMRMFPNYQQVTNRVRSFDGKANGENNFYCSEKCKSECVVFHFNSSLQVDPRSERYKPKTETQKARACQTKTLKQIQCDHSQGQSYCEKCGDFIDVELHHTLPIAEFGEESVNPAGHILLCAGCHVGLHRVCA